MRQVSISAVCAFALLLASALPASATDYYVSPSGKDTNPGTSSATAWRTIAKLNGVSFAAGDRILFEGGQTFTGTLAFDRGDAGTEAGPITVTSYGTGRA